MRKNKEDNLSTISDLIDYAAKKFSDPKTYFGHGTDNAWDEAVYLVLQVLKLPLDSGQDILDKELSASDKKNILGLIDARVRENIPVPYLTNEAWFAGFPFYVDERVLIPRSPISELIENRFVPWIDPDKVSRILDIGTGSGCIAIAASYAFPGAKIDAIDIFDDALEVATINCINHGIFSSPDVTLGSNSSEGEWFRLIKSDLFDKLDGQQYDIIISNPPYVANYEREDLPKEYCHEPEAALFAGNDGDEIVGRILKNASQYLSPEGILVVEVGNSAPVIMEKYPQLPFVWLEFECGKSEVFLLTKEQLLEFSDKN